VSVALARALGLEVAESASRSPCAASTSSPTFPAWRHAIINFPHPLLQHGLVILDTPGLNAIGAEPALTLNLLPSAHLIRSCSQRTRASREAIWTSGCATSPATILPKGRPGSSC
jgi:hypothetical protein